MRITAIRERTVSRRRAVFQPFGGFADGIRVEGGYVGLPDVPGVGFEAKRALYEVMRPLAE